MLPFNITDDVIKKINEYFQPEDTAALNLTNKNLNKLKLPCIDRRDGLPLEIYFQNKIFNNFKNFITSNSTLICAGGKNISMSSYQRSFIIKIAGNADMGKKGILNLGKKLLLKLGMCSENIENHRIFFDKIEAILPHVGGTDETEWFPRYRGTPDDEKLVIKSVREKWTPTTKITLENDASQLNKQLTSRAIFTIKGTAIVALAILISGYMAAAKYNS